jgi:Protein of unknown function (DUF2567)
LPQPEVSSAGPWAEPSPPREPLTSRGEVLLAVITVVGLVILGVLLGLLWAKISPDRPRGLVIDAGIIPDETESFVASDGRFAIITGLVGVVSALALWLYPGWRGPTALAGLAVGSALGALATDGVGRLVGGGHSSGKVNSTISALPLQVHATVLLAVQCLLAMLVYFLLSLFSSHDDLGSVRHRNNL